MDDELPGEREGYWSQPKPLQVTIVIMIQHDLYHAGEINQLLAIRRGEAWEEGEEVEENHIATEGHRVTPPWRRQEPVF